MLWRIFRKSGPFYGVLNDSLYIFIVVCGVALVARTEVEHFAHASVVAQSGTEHLATLEPADKQQLVWSGDVKALSVHFLVRQFKVLRQSSTDRMRGYN